MTGFETFWAIHGNLVLTLGTNALLALSIWVTLSCGMLTMANAGFMALGAYSSSILTTQYNVAYPLALLVACVVPAVVAGIIGRRTLRISGVYLAMATLAFGEVVRIAILNAEPLTGGALGLNSIPQLTQWWHVVLALAAVIVLLQSMRRSRVGRAFEAIREDETAAGLMGINVQAHKSTAFMIGAAIAGLAGGLNAHLTFFIGPNEYGFDRGVEILAMAILGGVSSIIGPILGSATLTLLPEVLRGMNDYRLIVNGLILVAVVLFLPKGMWNPRGIQQFFVRRKGGAA